MDAILKVLLGVPTLVVVLAAWRVMAKVPTGDRLFDALIGTAMGVMTATVGMAVIVRWMLL